MPARSSGRSDQSARAGDSPKPKPVDTCNNSRFARSSLARYSKTNPPQEQQGPEHLVTQRAAQSQRVTARIADRALLDAYVKVGLDAGVRKFLRGAKDGVKNDGGVDAGARGERRE